MKEIISNMGYLHQFQPTLEPDPDGTPLAGICDQDQRIIDINEEEMCCNKEKLTVFAHEEIHAVYPELDEREVWAWTKAILREITPKQKVMYFNLYDRNPTT